MKRNLASHLRIFSHPFTDEICFSLNRVVASIVIHRHGARKPIYIPKKEGSMYEIILLYCNFVLCLDVPCLVLPCLLLPYPALSSCLVLSCLVLSCLVLSCLVLSCLIFSCLVLSCLVLSCLALPSLVLSCLDHPLNLHVGYHHTPKLLRRRLDRVRLLLY
jgi:hypothetical protein